MRKKLWILSGLKYRNGDKNKQLRILFIEDNTDLSGVMQNFLSDKEYEVKQIFDGDKVVDKMK